MDSARTRARNAERRGGGLIRTTLGSDIASHQFPLDDLIVINEALEALAAADNRAARVVELRFYGGLDEREIAEVLGVAEITVRRDWKTARAWLLARLGVEPKGT